MDSIFVAWQYHSPRESSVHCASDNIDTSEMLGSTSVPRISNLSGEPNSLKISVIILCSTFTTLLTYIPVHTFHQILIY